MPMIEDHRALPGSHNDLTYALSLARAEPAANAQIGSYL
jgi:hypothetical protein